MATPSCFGNAVVALGHTPVPPTQVLRRVGSRPIPMGRSCLRAHIMKSLIVKRSIYLAGNKTSVSLENEFWNALKNIADDRHLKVSELIGDIDAQRQHRNLSSALRLFVLEYHRRKAAGEHGGEHSVSPARVIS